MASPDLTRADQEAVPRTSVFLLMGWLALVIAGCVLAAVAHSTKVLPADLAVAREIQSRALSTSCWPRCSGR